MLFQLLVVGGLLAIVWFSFGQNVLAPRGQPGLPERLGELQLVSRTEGAEAIAQISQLHGTSIELLSADIIEYAHDSPYHGSSRATVWVGSAESEAAAAELTARMVAGITKGGSGFTNLRQLTIADNEVFQVDGPGGEHFFYHSAEQPEKVIWLTIEAADALTIMEEAVRTLARDS